METRIISEPKFKDLIELKNKVNEYFDVKIESRSRKRNIVYAKKVYCKLAKENFPFKTLYEIGRIINLKHDNVIYHLRSFHAVYKEYKTGYMILSKRNPRTPEKERKDAIRLALFYRKQMKITA